MAETFETFEIDDDFDPLEDLEPADDKPESESEASDYQMPEGGEESSFVAEAEPQLPPCERIAQLLDRMPGQKARLLAVVAFCDEPRTLAEISDHVEEAFPSDVSVYGPDRLVALLERAGAIAGEGGAEERADDVAARGEVETDAAASVASGDSEGAYLTVEQAEPRTYTATEDGRAFSGASARVGEILALVREDDGRYAPLYREILELTSPEGGCSVKDINAAIDPNPLCEEPRRFATYFLNRMERAGGVVWEKNWRITEFGRAVLQDDALAQA